MLFIAAVPRRRWKNSLRECGVEAECSQWLRPSQRSPVSSKCTTGEALMRALTWARNSVEIGGGAGGHGGDGAVGHGDAEQFADGDGGAFLGQELSHEQVDDDGAHTGPYCTVAAARPGRSRWWSSRRGSGG